MTWKLYALASGGALLATSFVLPPTAQRRADDAPEPQARTVQAGATVDLGKQADRLHARIVDTGAYRHPVRDAFRFGAAARPRSEMLPAPAEALPPVPVAPIRPPFALAGMAESTENGRLERTAILTSLRGVQLVKEGDLLDGGYRVVAVGEETITLHAPDGTESTLRLSAGDIQ